MADVINSGISGFLKLPTELKNVATEIAIFGAPFDTGTTNRPGARFAPAAIREASCMLADGWSPTNVVDFGNISVQNGNTPASLMAIYENAVNYLQNFKLLTMGGDHTITLPLLQAHAEKHGQLGLVHFDAHTDCWKAEGGIDSHGTWLRTAIEKKYVDPHRIVQIGIRSPMPPEVNEWTMKQGITRFSPTHFHFPGPNYEMYMSYIHILGRGPTYITFDIDCIDPSQAPGTGTPEIAGLFTHQILLLLGHLEPLNVVGADLVEVLPAYDNAQITSLTAATIMCELLKLMGAK
jgi:agmatinase